MSSIAPLNFGMYPTIGKLVRMRARAGMYVKEPILRTYTLPQHIACLMPNCPLHVQLQAKSDLPCTGIAYCSIATPCIDLLIAFTLSGSDS